MATAPVKVPGEWEAHAGIWLAWPTHPDWGSELPAARAEWMHLAHALEDAGETLHIAIPPRPDGSTESPSIGELANLRNATLHRLAYGDIWLRDTGPVFALDVHGRRRALCFRFNGWGEKYRYPGDEDLALRITRTLGVPSTSFNMVLEGGAVETDGEGTAITTRTCLLDPKRNPGRSMGELEETIREAYGANRVVWLERGLLNDHTDGHVDTLARFVRPGVVTLMEPSQSDPNRDVLREVRQTLSKVRLPSGEPITLMTIPSPGEVRNGRGELLPASYLNFVIANRAVMVPTYGVSTDDSACRALEACFPERPVVGLSARALLTGGGAFHCITQQMPKDSSNA